MNVYVSSRYDERIVQLAVGIEPRDAASNQRLGADLDVRIERFGSPVGEWRPWRAGETLTTVLPRMHRHHTGRFAHRYDQGVTADFDVRLVHHGRRIVPRRLRAAVPPAGGPPVPIWQRAFPVWCMPGSAAHLPSRTTVLRGTIVRDDGTGQLVAVRWARVRLRNAGGLDVAWAHGDDRGEFVAVVTQSPDDLVVPVDPLPVTITIGATLPPPDPDPADPLRAQVDPLWDLPLETIAPSATPETEATLTGRRFLPGHSLLSPLDPPQPVALPHGTETSVVIRIA
ncbi:MAG: hypothetical protein JJE52_01775 [Acidimicrobiia bacterium]|nr:hypothetical protein [Acidimicrobiia bacterium]